MAQVYDESVVITVSKLLRRNEEAPEMMFENGICDQIEAVVQEMFGEQVVVEVVRAPK